ncbi:MAG: hypothetical protein KC561_02155 [Myxococcales bacterium]|nr:hypothetical protein [Myxococcales bacterium]
MKPFEGFDATDFETYTSEKWADNRFNLQRLKVKQKLAALASALKSTVDSLGLDLAHELSAERPSIWNQKQVADQWLYYIRGERAQRELQSIIDRERGLKQSIEDPAHHHRHFAVGIRVDAGGLAVLCGAHPHAWLDRRNLSNKLADEHERAKVLAYLRKLEPGFKLQIGDARTPAPEVEEAQLVSLSTGIESVADWIAVEYCFETTSEEIGRADFAGQLAKTIEGLVPFYSLLAWSKANDFAAIADKVAEVKKERKRTGSTRFAEADEVEIVGGLFAGRSGVVTGYEGGKVKVKVGTLTLPVSPGALKLRS